LTRRLQPAQKGAWDAHWAAQVGLIMAGLALLVLGSDWLVSASVAFAKAFGVSDLVIGLTIVAAGTSMPEVATSITAALKGERDIAVGNVVGSNTFNILGCVGLSGLVSGSSGLTLAPSLLNFDIWVMLAVALACLPVFLTGREIARWEGGVFLGYYVAYVAYLILAAQQHAALQAFSATMLGFVVPLTIVVVAWLRTLVVSPAPGCGGRCDRSRPAAGRSIAGVNLCKAPVRFAPHFAADFGSLVAAAFVGGGGHQRRNAGGFATVVDRHHGEEAAVHVPHRLRANVLGHHLDAHFHGRIAGVVDAGEKAHQLAHVNGLAEHHLVHAERDHIAAGVAAGAGIGHLVQQLEDGATVHLAGEIRHVGRHEHGHREWLPAAALRREARRPRAAGHAEQPAVHAGLLRHPACRRGGGAGQPDEPGRRNCATT
jgi:hypothetical protein